jgi:hypothetical protein
MKIIVLLFVILFSTDSYSSVTNYYVILPEKFSNSIDPDDVYANIERVFFDALKQGDTLAVISDNQNTIAEFRIKDEDGYDSKLVKKKFFSNQLNKLQASIRATPKSDPGGSLKIPQILKFLSTQKLENTPDRKDQVLLIGSALYKDAHEPSFNMTDGVFPSDGHIRTTERFSVFGTDEKRGFLNGVSVHWLTTTPESDYASELYKYRVKRFWSLFMKNQGGILSTFSNDTQTAFDRFSKSANNPVENADFDYTANKVEMLRVTREAQAVNESKEQVRIADFMSDNVVLSNVPPSKNIGRMKIGIRWPCKDCDIDLYAKTNSGSKYLFFGNNSTEEGTYFKDFQNSPDTINGLEYIEFTKEVDVANIDAKINFYKGQTDKPVTGVVRIEFDGKVYEKPFIINATQGNNAGDDPNCWTTVNVKELLGMK